MVSVLRNNGEAEIGIVLIAYKSSLRLRSTEDAAVKANKSVKALRCLPSMIPSSSSSSKKNPPAATIRNATLKLFQTSAFNFFETPQAHATTGTKYRGRMEVPKIKENEEAILSPAPVASTSARSPSQTADLTNLRVDTSFQSQDFMSVDTTTKRVCEAS